MSRKGEKMKKKMMLAILVLLLSTSLPYFVAYNMASLSSPKPAIHVDPPRKQELVCEIFEININITDAEDLFQFMFNLTYDPTILEVLEDPVVGPFLERPLSVNSPEIRFPGWVKLKAMSNEERGAEPRSGNGILATIKFKCTGVGECDLILHASILNHMDGTEIKHDRNNGTIMSSNTRENPIPVDQDYTLCHDMNFSKGNGFNISASNVVLDLNGHTISALVHGRADYGVLVSKHGNVTIQNGTIIDFQRGIYIDNSTDEINIINITILNTDGIAIDAQDTSELHVVNNTISGSYTEGIKLEKCHYAVVSGNIVSKNVHYGIRIQESDNCTVSNNTIKHNEQSGIEFDRSSQNKIFNNNFINNTPNARNRWQSEENAWNVSYPYGGNYWDDYFDQSIFDKASGKNQTIPGPDGIGDTPYTIDGDNQDEYPLMNPYGSKLQLFDVTWEKEENGEERIKNCPIAIFSDSSMTKFNKTLIKDGKISFNVSGGTFCKVIFFRELLDGAFKVFIDGTPTAFILNWDETHIFLNVTYSEENHNVKIDGEIVFPISTEFPDIDGNGKIDIKDVALVGKHYGEEFPKIS